MSRARRPTALLGGLVLLLLLLLLGACGGSTAPEAAPIRSAAVQSPAPTTTSPSSSPSPCPVPSGSGDPWPAGVPDELPKPAGITVGPVTHQAGGLTVVRFSNPVSLRQNVLFVVKQLPAAGFVLGRGDAEATEADAPFQKGDVRGLLRMAATADCRTEWLLAFGAVKGPQQPALPSYTPSASPSPLPFG